MKWSQLIRAARARHEHLQKWLDFAATRGQVLKLADETYADFYQNREERCDGQRSDRVVAVAVATNDLGKAGLHVYSTNPDQEIFAFSWTVLFNLREHYDEVMAAGRNNSGKTSLAELFPASLDPQHSIVSVGGTFRCLLTTSFGMRIVFQAKVLKLMQFAQLAAIELNLTIQYGMHPTLWAY